MISLRGDAAELALAVGERRAMPPTTSNGTPRDEVALRVEEDLDVAGAVALRWPQVGLGASKKSRSWHSTAMPR